jgi:alkylation response protein AidB-like acyl-CoA dehydrogenase
MATVEIPGGGAPLTVLSEDEAMFRDAVRQFARDEVAPRVHRMDEAQKMDEDLIPQFFELGLMGIEVPESHGGTDASFFTAVLVVEELSRVDASVGVFVDVQNTLVNNAFLRWGSEALKEKYLPQLCAERVGAYALSEAGSGSDAFALATRGVEADGGYRLTGQKLWITNGAEAEVFIVFANVNPEAGYKGITAFVVEKDFEGFSVGKKEDKLGIRASSTTELVLQDVLVPAENVLGEVGQGYKVAIETLNEGRIGIGAQMIGIGQGALDATVRYVQEREQFGKRSAASRACSSSSRAWPRAGGRAAHGLQRRAPQGRRAALPAGGGDGEAASRPRSRSRSPRSASTCTAGTGSPRSTRWRSSTGTRRSARSTRGPATCSCKPLRRTAAVPDAGLPPVRCRQDGRDPPRKGPTVGSVRNRPSPPLLHKPI